MRRKKDNQVSYGRHLKFNNAILCALHVPVQSFVFTVVVVVALVVATLFHTMRRVLQHTTTAVSLPSSSSNIRHCVSEDRNFATFLTLLLIYVGVVAWFALFCYFLLLNFFRCFHSHPSCWNFLFIYFKNYWHSDLSSSTYTFFIIGQRLAVLGDKIQCRQE